MTQIIQNLNTLMQAAKTLKSLVISVTNTQDGNAPRKSKYIRGNNMPVMNQSITIDKKKNTTEKSFL